MRKWGWRVELLTVSVASGWATADWYFGRYVGPAVFVALLTMRYIWLELESAKR